MNNHELFCKYFLLNFNYIFQKVYNKQVWYFIQELGISKVGHLRRILEAINELRKDKVASSPTFSSDKGNQVIQQRQIIQYCLFHLLLLLLLFHQLNQQVPALLRTFFGFSVGKIARTYNDVRFVGQTAGMFRSRTQRLKKLSGEGDSCAIAE